MQDIWVTAALTGWEGRVLSSTVQSKVCKTCGRIYASEKDYLRGTSRFRVCSSGNLYFSCTCESTLFLPAGRYGWFDLRKVLPEEAWILLKTFSRFKGVPSVPQVCLDVIMLVENVDCRVQDVVDAVKLDPLFAASVFSLADVSRPITAVAPRTLHEAVAILGLKRMAEVAVLATCLQFQLETKEYTLLRHMEFSLMVGVAAECLANRFETTFARDLVFLAGALADVGKLGQALAMPEKTDAIYLRTQMLDHPESWLEAEKEMGIPSYRSVGELLGYVWGIPRQVIESMEFIEAPLHLLKAVDGEKLGTQYDLVEIVTLARESVFRMTYQSHLSQEQVYSSALARFKLDEPAFHELVEEIKPIAFERVSKFSKRFKQDFTAVGA